MCAVFRSHLDGPGSRASIAIRGEDHATRRCYALYAESMLQVSGPSDPQTVDLLRASEVPYETALAWQRGRQERVRSGGREALALIEHSPVYTMGRRGGRHSLRVPAESLRAPIVDIERGGDVTWHGPGQLVGYPILNVRERELRAADYVHALEAMLIEVLRHFDVDATTIRGRPGVWVQGAKVAAIGVAIRGGVSMHGFALNVNPDLHWFDTIIPCGIADATMTSLGLTTPHVPSIEQVADVVREAFEAQFASRLVVADSSSLRESVSA